MSTRSMQAGEARSAAEALAGLPESVEGASRLISLLKPHCNRISEGARVLDVGAAQGVNLVALERVGFEAVGVEPWDAARKVSDEVKTQTGAGFEMVAGRAEELPFEDASFDLVHAASVIEHVDDVERAYAEVNRVLKPGGGFYFNTTSSICPRQSEIAHIPLFPWFPGPAKRAIMRWAVGNRPSWVGHTEKPAMYWPTPDSARRELLATGFDQVCNRWDLLNGEGRDGWRGRAIGAASGNRFARLLANIAVEGIACLALKPTVNVHNGTGMAQETLS